MEPIHPSIKSKLDPEYVVFHEKYAAHFVLYENEPWDPAMRVKASPIGLGGMKGVEVRSVHDRDLGNFQARTFVPEEEIPEGGWPVLVWFHGGGWVAGGLASENAFLRHICKYVKCVVITINYRHAPEHIYPAAVNDVVDGFKWVINCDTARELCINTSRIAIGGVSAGACLAIILGHKIAEQHLTPKPVFQFLLCPVIDNTATTTTIWSGSKNAVWLTPRRMIWFREKYFPDPESTFNWDASPCFTPPTLLAQSAKTFIAIAGCDLLAPEGLRFAANLKNLGVDTEVQVYEGATHAIMLLAGIHKIGKAFVHDGCAALSRAIGTVYDADTSPVLRAFEKGTKIAGFVVEL